MVSEPGFGLSGASFFACRQLFRKESRLSAARGALAILNYVLDAFAQAVK